MSSESHAIHLQNSVAHAVQLLQLYLYIFRFPTPASLSQRQSLQLQSQSGYLELESSHFSISTRRAVVPKTLFMNDSF